MKFVLFCVGTFAAASISLATQRTLGLPYWGFYAASVAYAFVCYAVSAALIGRYIHKRAPGGFSTEQVTADEQAWELTAGTGIVPKWVSYIGLASFCFIFSIPFELAALQFR